MKRNQLKELGLTDEQIKSVMDLNGKDINKTKEEVSTLTTETENYKSQLAERDKDLKELRSQVKDNEELSSQFKDLQAKYKNDTTNLANELNQTKLNNAIDRNLTANHVRNTKAVKALLDMKDVKLDEKGNLHGLNDQLDHVKETDPYLFDGGSRQDYNPENGKPSVSDQTQAMIDVFKK